MSEVANDDWPEMTVLVIDPGPNRAAVFSLYRQLLRVEPAEAKRLLGDVSVEVARGPRMLVEDIARTFAEAGALVEVKRAETDPAPNGDEVS